MRDHYRTIYERETGHRSFYDCGGTDMPSTPYVEWLEQRLLKAEEIAPSASGNSTSSANR